jgi:proline iminopeptidase
MTAIERELFVVSEGARLWSIASGSGIPLVLFNGGPGCDDYLGPVAELIADVCQVVRFEPRGCGRSVWDGRYDLDTLLLDAEAVRRAHGIERWIVAGHSNGPNVALAYAIRHPARAIGMIGISGGKVVDDRHWSETYHARLASIGEDQGGKEFHADPQVNRQESASWREYRHRPGLFRDLASLKIPCIFINAAQDIRPNWPTQQLAELIPDGKYVEIAGAAHNIWLTHSIELRTELHNAISYIAQAENRASFPPSSR